MEEVILKKSIKSIEFENWCATRIGAICQNDDKLKMGANLEGLGKWDAAAACYQSALVADPENPAAYYCLSVMLRKQGKLALAEACCRRILAIDPDEPNAHFHLTFIQLLQGEYQSAWHRYEIRWRLLGYPSPRVFGPVWRGDADLAGKTILLIHEQGFGDTIQFSRFAKLLTMRGATVHLLVPPELRSLMQRCSGVSAVFHDTNFPPFDYQCPLMSLPFALNTELSTVPSGVPYITVDQEHVAAWKELLGARSRLRVGLVWSGGEDHPCNQERSMHFYQLRSLLEVTGVDFFTLQLGERGLRRSHANSHVLDFTEQIHDFYDTAGLIENLDLVISVDTAVAHLAGALGKPFWLINRVTTCWRWLTDRTDSPWYPSARIFRQKTLGDWDPVINEIKAALQDEVFSRQARTNGLPQRRTVTIDTL